MRIDEEPNSDEQTSAAMFDEDGNLSLEKIFSGKVSKSEIDNFKIVRGEFCMLYDYIITNYEKDEPIFLAELPGKSRESVRQEMKRLTDEGKIERLYNGVYYRAYKTILGTKGKVSVEKFIQKRYIEVDGVISGYITGIQLANMYGFTTQNPSCYEVCSNEASTKQRKVDVDGRQIIVYKPVVEISKENKGALQFLDLMSTIDRYSEVSGDEFTVKIKNFISTVGVDFEQVKKYLSLLRSKQWTPGKSYGLKKGRAFQKAEFLEVPYPKAQAIMTVCLFWFIKTEDMKILPKKTKKRQRRANDGTETLPVLRWESKPVPRFGGGMEDDAFGGDRYESGFGGYGTPRSSGSWSSGGVYGYRDSSPKPAPQKPLASTRRTSAPATGMMQLNQGDMVEHTAFGKGMVMSVRPMGGDALVEVAFNNVGTKKLMLKGFISSMFAHSCVSLLASPFRSTQKRSGLLPGSPLLANKNGMPT